ncbi:capsid maturation protease [Mycobacterium phage IdentityCrisis]|uniref:Capsid maturation protease n=1 Tax=Mycobacterium phage IdentityCrisis TaxID=2599866 RepID=A0A5J6TIY5_9CAUD|nr:capsid maturation protease [Mycobacterium phage IdentityCrisis]QFG10024.1 capsid maturation protease [Mycobacterium phage IdentityCrisis]
MALSPTEFQQLLAGLAADLGNKIDTLTPRLGQLDRREQLAFISDAYPALATPYLAGSGNLTAVFYDERPVQAAASDFVAVPADVLPDEQLAASARWAMLQSDPANALKGSATRAVFTSSRDTVILNARREGVRWARHASANACGFCRMLATRGAVYRGEALARKSHDHCHCVAVPDRDGTYEPPAYVEQWRADYDQARRDGATNAADIARGMQRASQERVRVAADRAAERRHAADVAAWLDAEDDHLSALAYWRRVDAEDLHRMPGPVTAEVSEVPTPNETPMERAVRELDEALASGDNDRVERAAIALEKLEDAERKATERKERNRERARARRAAKANEQAAAILAKIEQGYDPAEAEAEVTGKSVESIRRRDFVRMARAEGLRGENFEQLLSSAFHRHVSELAIEAENATNGFMLSSRYDGKVNAKELWYVSDKKAREMMSGDMAAWLDERGGRITRQIFKQMVLSGQYGLRRYTAMSEDFLQ